jgi:lysophospholipase L1-like esterase
LRLRQAVAEPRGQPIIRCLPLILTIGACAVGLLIVRNWAYVTTYRLYLAQRVDVASHSAAAQRFDIEDAVVVPQIASRGDDVIAFNAAVGRPSTLHVGVRPSGTVGYEIRWRDGAEVAVLARGEAAAPLTIVRQIPARAGVLELVGHGSITWIDPRLVRDLPITPHLIAIALLLAGAAATSRRHEMPGAPDGNAANRLAWYRRLAMAGGLAFVLLAFEGGLRALGDRVPGGIAAERHDLGEVRKDPRWQDTPRFGRRLRSRVDAVNEWRYGDIVRMGYIPASVSDGVLHRFTFRTDDEGFRNARVRPRIDVAALGDSFTDAMTLRIEDSWPAQLEHETGLAVQNYGTAGFGPQQELLALKEYAVRHHPRIVVLAYFAGNDLFDAEAFDEFTRSGGAVRRAVQGWQIKDVVSRADTWFLVSALRATGTWLSKLERAEARADASPARTAPDARVGAAPASGVAFDRGMFAATVNGRAMRWAFMPPYLNTLTFSERDLAGRNGWALTQQAIAEMQDVSRGIGATMIVMFLPFKSQVYLPWLAESQPASELSRELAFYLPDNPGTPDVEEMLRNRLAQNRLMRGFCEARGIPFLDTTDALTAGFVSGENMYFPDESHLNERGHAVVAHELAAHLRRSYAVSHLLVRSTQDVANAKPKSSAAVTSWTRPSRMDAIE